jgi:hypothetical protein
LVKYKKGLSERLNQLNTEKVKIEKAMVKIESDNVLGLYDSVEIYNGVKQNLKSKYKSIKDSIERLMSEFSQLGNHQLWLDWIDQFGNEFNNTSQLSAPKKKQLINGVVKDILVNYDQAKKLHRVRVNFRLPVLRSVGEILGANNAVMKRGGITPNTAETIENTGAPETVLWKLLHRHTLCQISWLVNITAAHHRNMIR